MKTMTCKQLGGACDLRFHAQTFDEIAKISKEHGKEMYQKGDQEHIKMMKEMMELMNDTKAMKEWFESKRNEFYALPDE